MPGFGLRGQHRTRHAVAKGKARVNGVELGSRDGAAIRDEAELRIEAGEDAEIVLVDAP